MEHSHLASKVSAALGCTTTNLVKHVDQLLQEQERQRQLIRQLQSQLAQSMQDTIQLDANAQDGKLTLQIHILPDDFPRDAISKRMAWYQQTTPRSAHLLLIKDHLTLLVDTTCNLHAGQLLRQLLTRVGGKGGGREESAQGRWTQAPSDPQTAANTLMTACCEILNATHTS
jgi:alanyl-tRNA synthetase